MITKVSFKNGMRGGSISIEEDNGEIFLFVDKDIVPIVNITAKDLGMPGVTGTDVCVKLKDVVKEINNKALVYMFPDALS